MRKQPTKEKLCTAHGYYEKTREDWRDDFIEQYHKYKPTSARLYGEMKEAGTPSWTTISKMFGIKRWRKWLEFCDITPYVHRPTVKPVLVGRSFTVPGNPKFEAYLNLYYGMSPDNPSLYEAQQRAQQEEFGHGA